MIDKYNGHKAIIRMPLKNRDLVITANGEQSEFLDLGHDKETILKELKENIMVVKEVLDFYDISFKEFSEAI